MNPGDLTQSPGNDSASGKAPAHPMASLTALIAAYHPGAGDVIHVDAGTYHLVRNVVLDGSDSGLTIVGPSTAAALFDRGNTIYGDYDFELAGATGVTLDHLSMTDAYDGVAVHDTGSFGLTVSNSDIYGLAEYGIDISGYSITSGTITGNTVHDNGLIGISTSGNGITVSNNTVYDNRQYGIQAYPGVYVPGDTVTGNTAYANGNGINAGGAGTVISGNTAYGNASAGIIDGGGLAIDNTVYGQVINGAVSEGILLYGGAAQDNVVFGNANGIVGGGNVLDNRVYHNQSVGIYVSGGTVQGNDVYSNAIGIQGLSLSNGFVVPSQYVFLNNLVYANATAGIIVDAGSDAQVTNNTVIQFPGDALRIQYGTSNSRVSNNILEAQGGYALTVSADSEVGFSSDYNDFFFAGAGVLGQWEGLNFSNVADWFHASGLDEHSMTSDPGYVNPAGPDDVVGYDVAAGVNRGLDDNFQLRLGSPDVDAGDPVSPYLNEPSPNGDRVDIGGYGNTSRSTASPAQSVQVLSPGNLYKVQAGRDATISWIVAGVTPVGSLTSRIDVLPGGDATKAIRIADAAPDGQDFTWAVPIGLAPGQYILRITSNDGTHPQGYSGSFLLAEGGHDFYVNDGSTAGDVFTTAPGDDNASGKSPAHPMASLPALIAAYHPGAGDTIHVDTGTYVLTRSIDLDPSESGLTIVGPSLATALIDRNLTLGYNVNFNLAGATDVTIDHLSITGADVGIQALASANSQRLTISNDDIFGNVTEGIAINTGNDGAVITGNKVHNNDGNYSALGILVSGQDTIISDNQVYGNFDGIEGISNQTGPGAAGIVIRDNVVHDNAAFGIIAGTDVTATGNEVFGQSGTAVPNAIGGWGLGIDVGYYAVVTDNTVHGNTVGIFDDSYGSTIASNRVYNSSAYGIISFVGDTVQGNDIFSNAVGMYTSGSGPIIDNLVYANTNQGIVVGGGDGRRIIANNTVVQDVGDAVELSGASNVDLRNNILSVQAGYDLYVADDSHVGLNSNDNLFSTGNNANAQVGYWGGNVQTLAAWQLATSQDANSVAGDPKFVNPSGADHVLGYSPADGGYDGGADDNFALSAGSPAIDHGDSWAAPATDITGSARKDDPGTPNAGSPDYFETDLGSSDFTKGGTAQGWRGVNALWGLNLPFAFPFYDGSYSYIAVSSEGYLILGGNNFSDSNNSDARLLSERIIAPFWGAIRTDGSGNDIFVDTTQSGQVTIRWDATNEADGSDVNFAVTLFQDGRIRFDYGDGNTGISPTVGLSYGNGAVGLFSAYDGRSALTDADSVDYTLKPGFIDIGAYEFQGSSLNTIPPKVVSTDPTAIQSGSSTSIEPGPIDVTFSEPLNPIDANAPAEYQLIGAGADGIFGTSDDIRYTTSPQYTPGSEVVTLSLNTPGGTLPIGTFQLTIFGAPDTGIHDLSGLRLDGKGDGTPGSDYVRTFTVTATPTATVLTPGAASVIVGQSVTFVASVSSTTGPPAGGSVQFLVNGSDDGVAVPLSGGTAQLSITEPAGSYAVTAQYTGDGAGYAPSPISAISSLVVVNPTIDTTTTVQSSEDPSKLGDPVTFTATVSSDQVGSGPPTGTAQFSIDGNPFGGPVTVLGGLATLTTSALVVGNHTISAAYASDSGRFNTSSGTLSGSQEIDKADVSIGLTVDHPISTYGHAVTFTVGVAAITTGLPAPSGTVTISEGETNLGRASLINGQATIITSALPIGDDSIVAHYSGDGNFNQNTTTPFDETVVPVLTSTSIASVTPNPRNAIVSAIDVTFSVPIDTSSLAPGALTMTDDGGSNLINGGVFLGLVHGTTTTYAIGGLAGLTTTQGQYMLTVNAADIQDQYGNRGTGTDSTSWLTDTTPPISRMNALASRGTTLGFPVSVAGSDPNAADGGPASGVASYAIYVSINGGSWSQWMTVPASSPTAIYTGQSNTTYSFYSIATDLAGNVENKKPLIEASTYLPDLTPPVTAVNATTGTNPSTLNSTTGTFTLDLTGNDPGGAALTYFEVFISVDGGTYQEVGPYAIPAGFADSSGNYHSTITYQGLTDGQSHSYAFYSIGLDAAGNFQGAAEEPQRDLRQPGLRPGPARSAPGQRLHRRARQPEPVVHPLSRPRLQRERRPGRRRADDDHQFGRDGVSRHHDLQVRPERRRVEQGDRPAIEPDDAHADRPRHRDRLRLGRHRWQSDDDGRRRLLRDRHQVARRSSRRAPLRPAAGRRGRRRDRQPERPERDRREHRRRLADGLGALERRRDGRRLGDGAGPPAGDAVEEPQAGDWTVPGLSCGEIRSRPLTLRSRVIVQAFIESELLRKLRRSEGRPGPEPGPSLRSRGNHITAGRTDVSSASSPSARPPRHHRGSRRGAPTS